MSRTEAVLPSVTLLLVLSLITWFFDETGFHMNWILPGLIVGVLLIALLVTGKIAKQKYVCDIAIVASLMLIGFTFLLRRIFWGYDGFSLGFLTAYFVFLVSISIYRRRLVDWNDLTNC